MYVLFEGIDTCGKSTQLDLIAQRVPEILTTKEPGGTPFGVKLREILLHESISSNRAELLLFLSDRAEHYHSIIKPNAHKVILSDRGFLSGIGYALANGSFEFEELLWLNRFALEGQLPDRVILFLTDEETLRRRIGAKTPDGIELRGLTYLLRVQEQMKQSLIRLNIPHLFIDATEGIEDIHQTILAYLKL